MSCNKREKEIIEWPSMYDQWPLGMTQIRLPSHFFREERNREQWVVVTSKKRIHKMATAHLEAPISSWLPLIGKLEASRNEIVNRIMEAKASFESIGHPNNFVPSVCISLSKYEAVRSARLMKLLVSLSRHRYILFSTTSFLVSVIVMSRMHLYFASREYTTHRELLVETFQLHDESKGGKALHPSKPFFVMEDESSGKILLSLDDKESGHPLNRLADLRSPREEGRETVFFFHVPKVRTCKLL